ncbi:MAG: dockerin type I domain-containing protein, partial [Planctomycetota bacterium]
MSSIWNRAPQNSPSRSTRRRALSRRLRTEFLESRQLLAADAFHNDSMPADVNTDGVVSPIDVLAIVNNINARNTGRGQANRGPDLMTDVNNDGTESAIDALMVRNELNRRGAGDNRPPGGREDDQRGSEDNSDPGQNQETNDVVLQWNDLFNTLLVENTTDQNPGYASRAMAMLNLAIFDAVSLADGNSENAFYEYDLAVNPNAEVRSEIAASEAAYTVLSSLYPGQQETIDAFRDDLFSRFRASPVTGASIELGQEVGNSIIEIRSNDGSADAGSYEYYDDAGYFQVDPLNPDVPVWGPAWGEVDPFVISSAEDYAPESPPDLTSEQYAASYNEVKELGSVDSTSRTAEQTEIGIFW